jgi:rRNA-processing protein FCF1
LTGDGSSADLPIVLLDTNALLMPFQMGLDVEGEVLRVMGRCRMVVPRVVVAELRTMGSSLRDGAAALTFAERFEVMETVGLGDDAVVDLAIRTGGTVVTGDRGLIKRLHAAGLRVLRPRQKKQLELK